MLMRQSGEEVEFLASAFIFHDAGYLLTVAHATAPDEELIVASPEHSAGESGGTAPFMPATLEHVAPLPVSVVQYDADHDVALLKFKVDLSLSAPNHVVGNPGGSRIGTTLMSLGFSFGHYRVHTPTVLQSVLSGKMQSTTGTNVVLFDRAIHAGDPGGPLVNVTDERVIGIVAGAFDPIEQRKEEHEKGVTVTTSLSYATSIEYGDALLRREGVESR